MTKIDYKKELKHLYNPSKKEVVMVDVPEMNYLMVDGVGEPGNQDYQDAVEALFKLSYTLKFMIKKGQGIDYGVMPLEGLWWAEDMTQFSVDRKEDWLWTMMMMQPKAHVTAVLFEEAVAQVQKKKDLPALSKVRFEAFAEGKAAQIMHIGPFSEEGPTVARVHAFIEEQSALRGKHHEIYLSDIRRANPQKWRTVIRQPMV